MTSFGSLESAKITAILVLVVVVYDARSHVCQSRILVTHVSFGIV